MTEPFPTEVEPEIAAEAMQERGALFLDVRTVVEFRRGHPTGALNIPILFVDPNTGQPRPNSEFLAAARAHLEPDAEIYCGCRSGVRSLQATMLLRQAGFERVANVAGGFEGSHDPLGRSVSAGWVDRGLPVSEGEGGAAGWEALREAIETDAGA